VRAQGGELFRRQGAQDTASLLGNVRDDVGVPFPNRPPSRKYQHHDEAIAPILSAIRELTNPPPRSAVASASPPTSMRNRSGIAATQARRHGDLLQTAAVRLFCNSAKMARGLMHWQSRPPPRPAGQKASVVKM